MTNNHIIRDDDNRFIIDGSTRAITNLTGNTPSVMQFDHNSEVLTFQMPRFMEGHDMSLCDEIKVLYKNTEEGTGASTRPVIADVDTINDIEIDENENCIVFSWAIPEFATLYPGKIVFQFKFVCYGYPKSVEPNFKLYSDQYSFIEVRPSLDVSDNLDARFPNLLDEIESRLRAFKNEIDSGGYILVADMNLSEAPNAYAKLPIPTVKNADGSNASPVSPKVLYFPEGFGGYKFWMACLVASNSMQSLSYSGGNPSILCSNDMVTWVTPEGVNVPISVIDYGLMGSEIHLVYNSDTALLEIWYRYAFLSSAGATIAYESRTYRSTSPNGIEWSEFEVIYNVDAANNNTGYVADQVCRNPVVIYENGVYKIWARSGGFNNNFDYYESVDGTNWTLKTSTNLVAADLDIIRTSSGYEAFIHDTTNGEKLYHSVSDDGIVWSDKVEILGKTSNTMNWESSKLGRASAIKANGNYYVFYTGFGGGLAGIGLTVSSVVDDVTSIRGYVSGEAISTTMSGLLQTIMPKLKGFDESVSIMEEWGLSVEERLNTIEETINAMGEWASRVEERLSGLGAPANTESE